MTKNQTKDPNKFCVFPWRYNDEQEIYNGCANPDDDARGLWCPTETDSSGAYKTGMGTWGHCWMEDEGGYCTADSSDDSNTNVSGNYLSD